MKLEPLKLPASLPCATCGGKMFSFDGSRIYICQASPLHRRYLSLREFRPDGSFVGAGFRPLVKLQPRLIADSVHAKDIQW